MRGIKGDRLLFRKTALVFKSLRGSCVKGYLSYLRYMNNPSIRPRFIFCALIINLKAACPFLRRNDIIFRVEEDLGKKIDFLDMNLKY